jgi:cytochrome c biogenesis protein CcdA
MIAGSVVLAFIAGTLSVLSPCVLPILPIVLGAAASADKWSPLALATGLAFSFVIVGLFVATIGYAIGLDSEVFRTVSALLMIAIGMVLLVPRLASGLAVASVPIANWTDQRFESLRGDGPASQFRIGVLLGAGWSPCVGPTLGAASLLAAQSRDLPQVALTMFVFGIGAALPLLALGLLSREAVLRWHHRLASTGQGLRAGLGVLLVAIGTLVLTGADKAIEARLVNASPAWLTDVTTRF